MEKAKIADVAKLAGVSIKTVSRVANHEPNVREHTREIVQKAIDELDYRPNPSARSLAARRSFLIGLLYDNPSASYLVNIQNGALRTCRNEGYELVIHPCDYQSKKLTNGLIAMVQSSRVDGVILTPPLSEMKKVLRTLKDLGTPFVRVSPADARHPSRSVITNDEEICAEMTRYLISLGHRRIAFIQGHPDHKAVANRYTGYVSAMKEDNIPERKSLVKQGFNSLESGESCARQLLGLKSPPTAIFAANDDMAAGVLRAAHSLGVKVPQELSVVGFDDTPIARQVWPALTTIHQPIKSMVEQASRLLLRNLGDEASVDIDRQIPCSLVVRDSTGPAAET